MPQYNHCSGDIGRSWALSWGAGRAQAGTAGVRGHWAWRAGRRTWVRRQAAAARGRRRAGRARQAGRRSAGRERQARRRRAARWA